VKELLLGNKTLTVDVEKKLFAGLIILFIELLSSVQTFLDKQLFDLKLFAYFCQLQREKKQRNEKQRR